MQVICQKLQWRVKQETQGCEEDREALAWGAVSYVDRHKGQRMPTELVFLIPRRHDVHYSWHEARFDSAQNEASSENASIALNLAHAGTNGAPADG